MSKYAHIEWLDLQDTGVLTECAIMKRDDSGNIYYIALKYLDNVDKVRLRNILLARNTKQMELWDAMQQHTLGNGINALSYFHQLVKIKTPGGKIIDPRVGTVGAPVAKKTTKAAAKTGSQTAE